MGIFVLLALGVGVWWMIWGRVQGPLKVKAVAVTSTSMQENVYATGSVVPVSRQDVRVLTPALVAKVGVKVGDSVQAGQTLVNLDTTLADAQVAQAKASVEAAQTSVSSAQSNLNEVKKAQSVLSTMNSLSAQNSGVGTGANNDAAKNAGNAGSQISGLNPDQQLNRTPQVSSISSGTVQQAEGVLAQSSSALKQAQEALKAAQVQQEQLTYKSAISGTVLQVNAQSGNLSPAQQPLVSVADLSQMNVEAQLNEVDAGKVQLNRKVKVTSRVLGSTSLQGTVTQIAPEAVTGLNAQGNTSPTVGVKIHLDQAAKVLKPGYTVSLQIIVATKQGTLAVPLEALFQEGSKNYVYLIQNGQLLKKEVQVGIGNETQQEVTAGLKAGELVVLNPSTQLEQGMQVTPDLGSEGT
jgi:RND family efflux transporter, MFP subunit